MDTTTSAAAQPKKSSQQSALLQRGSQASTAFALRPFLVLHLETRSCPITYGKIASYLGVNHRTLGGPLAILQDQDRRAGVLLISALVVNEKTGLPGDGFFEQARSAKGGLSDAAFWAQQLKLLGAQSPVPFK